MRKLVITLQQQYASSMTSYSRTQIKSRIAKVLVSIFLLLTSAYALYQARGIIAGPYIYIESPENGTTTQTALVTIIGRVERSKEVLLNDRPIFIDLGGNFGERLLLNSGYNIISIKARDAQLRERTETLEIVYQPQ